MTYCKTLAALLAAACLSTAAVAQIGNNDNVLNPNTADEEQLFGVTHIDAAIVNAIMDRRPLAEKISQEFLAPATA